MLNKADQTRFQAAQRAIHEALITLAKFDGVDGESKNEKVALQVISRNAQIIQALAKSAGNRDIATFMATLNTWSTSGDKNERTAKLVKEIEAGLMALKVRSK